MVIIRLIFHESVSVWSVTHLIKLFAANVCRMYQRLRTHAAIHVWLTHQQPKQVLSGPLIAFTLWLLQMVKLDRRRSQNQPDLCVSKLSLRTKKMFSLLECWNCLLCYLIPSIRLNQTFNNPWFFLLFFTVWFLISFMLLCRLYLLSYGNFF